MSLAEAREIVRVISCSVLQAGGAAQNAKNDESEITPEMIEAGFSILEQAHITDDLLEADKELVVEIYRRMSSLRRNHVQSPSCAKDQDLPLEN